ncbi:MAG: TIGR02996 domain-containing protein [Myxococcales bacterium]|nr:TIGR02996 domain-containing protein [Myxococcales bacterium]
MPSADQLLLEAICTHPHDDDARLVYADWCTAHDPARSDLIRVQVERARLPSWDLRQPRLKHLEDRLLRAGDSAWRAQLPDLPGCEWGPMSRGFVASVRVRSFTDLVAQQHILAHMPGLQCVLVPWPSDPTAVNALAPLAALDRLVLLNATRPLDPAALVDAPWWSGVRHLAVMGLHEPPLALGPLLASGRLQQLRSLHLDGDAVDPAHVHQGFAPGLLEHLGELRLTDFGGLHRTRELSRDTVQVLSSWPGLAQVHTLSLDGSQLAEVSLERLLVSPHVCGLRRLHLAELPSSITVPWRRAHSSLTLHALDLGNREFQRGEDWHAPCLTQLKELALSVCDWPDPEHLRALLDAPLLETLQVLQLPHAHAGEAEQLDVLGEADLPALHTLDISETLGVSDDEVAGYLRSPAVAGLQSVVVQNAGEATIEALATSPYLAQLEHIDVGLDRAALKAFWARRRSEFVEG